MKTKMRFVCVVIVLELGLGMAWYLFSVGGRRASCDRLTECTLAERRVAEEQRALEALEAECEEWEQDTFFVERDAREKLAMSRPDETIVVM